MGQKACSRRPPILNPWLLRTQFSTQRCALALATSREGEGPAGDPMAAATGGLLDGRGRDVPADGPGFLALDRGRETYARTHCFGAAAPPGATAQPATQ